MAFCRNAVGHKLSAGYSRDDALRLVARVDLLLSLLAPFGPKKSTA